MTPITLSDLIEEWESGLNQFSEPFYFLTIASFSFSWQEKVLESTPSKNEDVGVVTNEVVAKNPPDGLF